MTTTNTQTKGETMKTTQAQDLEKNYIILSGEGTHGTFKEVYTDDIQAALDRERCNGQRWARAYCGDLHQMLGLLEPIVAFLSWRTDRLS